MTMQKGTFLQLAKNLIGVLRRASLLGIGLVMVMMNGSAQGGFKLKPPSEYFANGKSVALLQAALAGDSAKAKQLVADGANPNDEGPMNDANANRLRLLHYAIAANSKQAVQVLIGVGADPELVAQNYGRAFMFAVTIDNVEMLSVLLDLRPIGSLSKETVKYLLFESVRLPRPRCLELLLKRGAPIDFQDGRKYTVLMTALDVGDFDLAEWLLRQGASVKIETPAGVTPAYQVQSLLGRIQPGSESYLKLERIKNLMQPQGAVFPASEPAEVRARRGLVTK